jgi:WD40 repeat protein
MLNHRLNKNAIVAILSEKEDKQAVLDGKEEKKVPLGTGFFISNQFVLTCAHVLSSDSIPPVNEIFYLRTIDGDVIEAKLKEGFWRDPEKEDIAILSLINSPLERTVSLRFSCSDNINGHKFETYGFPEGHPGGLQGSGTILGLNPGILASLQLQSGEIVQGFSGGPVFDHNTGCVVGMISEKIVPDIKSIRKSGKNKSVSDEIVFGLREVALSIPSSIIRDICRDCEGLNFQEICPYQGLDSFTEERSDYFFGRDKLVKKLIRCIEKSPQFLSVIGTSGSGKSSVIRAKLLPYLRDNGVLATDHKTSIITIRFSGNQSLEEFFLNLICKRISINESEEQPASWEFLENFGSSSMGDRLIIFIDQFEELFTLHTPDSTEALLSRLNRLLEINRSITLVLASRIEFESQLEESPFSHRLGKGSFQVRGIPGEDLELDKIIIKPAEMVGLIVEEGLADRITEDLGATKNPLPLLEFALKKLWEIDVSKHEKYSLTLKTYKENFSSISNVLFERADEVYRYRLSNYSSREWEREGERSEVEKKLMRSILGRLIKFNSQSGTNGIPDTRCRAIRSEIEGIANESEEKNIHIYNLLNQMIGVGLLALDEDDSSIEIIHDVLVKEWISALTVDGINWLDMQREFRLWQQRLGEDIFLWESRNHEDASLLSDSRLTIADEYFTHQKDELTATERDYILKSLERNNTQRKTAEKEEKEKLEQKVELENERKEKLVLANANKKAGVILFATIIVSGIVAGCITFFAYQRDQFSQKASHSEQVSREALKKFPLGQLDALGSAVEAAKELQEITKDIHDIKDYPTLGPITVLRKILDEIKEYRHFNGKQGEIRGAVFLPGGDRFITAGAGTGQGGLMKIWSSSGDFIGELKGHEAGVISDEIKAIAIGGNQQSLLIASAGGDETVKVWDKEGKLIRNLDLTGQKESKPFTSIAVSKDGQRIMVGQSNGMVHLWERSGKLLKRWAAHSQEVTGVSFSGDGQKIVTSSEDGLARVWTLAGNKMAELKSPNVKKVMGVSFSGDGKWIATASDDQVARIWTVAGKVVKRLEGHEGLVTVANFSPDGQTVATASDDGTVKLWDVKTGQKLQDFRGHRGVVWTASFSQDGKHLVSTGRDGEIRLWNLEAENSKVTALLGFTDDVNAIVFSPDGKTIVGAGNEGVMRQWNRSGKEVKIWNEAIFQRKNVQDLAFSSDGKLLLASGLTSIARVWKVGEQNTDEPFIKLKGGDGTEKAHQGNIHSIAVSPNGELIATGSTDRTIRIWKITAPYGELIAVTPEQEEVISRVIFTSDGQKIISADWTGTVAIWNLKGKQIKQFKHVHSTQIRGLAVTQDGEKFVTADKMGNIKILDASGKTLKEFKSYQSGINELTISPDGQLIATAGMDKTARLWDFQGRQVAEFYNSKGAVWGIAFSPDSRSIAFSGDKGCTVVRFIDRLDSLLSKSYKWLH